LRTRLPGQPKDLPTGAVSPYDFGFIPYTGGGDGDPLDVLVLMDEPAFTASAEISEAVETEQSALIDLL